MNTAGGSFDRYSRTLTRRGGVLLAYRALMNEPWIDRLRTSAFLVGIVLLMWQLFFERSLPVVHGVVLLLIGGLLLWSVAFCKLSVRHSLEVHPDGLFVDGKYFFPIDEIGENWPSVQLIDDDPDRMVVCGIVGTRFIEYTMLCRFDRNDRTPERLVQDLELAMEQLWGRRDANVPAA